MRYREFITETIDFGYWSWPIENYIQLAKAVRQYMANKGVNLETGEGYEEFFTPNVIAQAGEPALEILEDLANGSLYDAADTLKAQANYENTANGITDLMDFIGFQPPEELNAGAMQQWNKEANELMASVDAEAGDKREFSPYNSEAEFDAAYDADVDMFAAGWDAGEAGTPIDSFDAIKAGPHFEMFMSGYEGGQEYAKEFGNRELMASRGQLPKAQARIRRHKLR